MSDKDGVKGLMKFSKAKPIGLNSKIKWHKTSPEAYNESRIAPSKYLMDEIGHYQSPETQKMHREFWDSL